MFNTLRSNLALLKYVRHTLGVHVNPFGFWFGSVRGKAIRTATKQGLIDGHICLHFTRLFSDKFALTLLHEAGHVLSKDGWHDVDIVAEMAAWMFAFKEMNKLGIKISADNYGHMQACICSYACDLDRVEWRANTLASFTTMFNDIYLSQ